MWYTETGSRIDFGPKSGYKIPIIVLQSIVVSGFPTGRNTLRRHLYVMGLCSSTTCRKCDTEEETSVRVLCECEALGSLKHAYLGSFFLGREDIRKLSVGAT